MNLINCMKITNQHIVRFPIILDTLYLDKIELQRHTGLTNNDHKQNKQTGDKYLLIKSHETTQGQTRVTATYQSKHFLFGLLILWISWTPSYLD